MQEENVAVLRSSSTRVPSVSRKELPYMKLLKLRFLFLCVIMSYVHQLQSSMAANQAGPLTNVGIPNDG